MKGLRSLGALLAMVSGFVFLPTATGTSLADTASAETTFSAFNCIVPNFGHKSVPAGSTVVIRQSLFGSMGNLNNFVNAQTTLISINDAPMSDVSDQFPAPVRQPDGSPASFGTSLAVPTGVTLANPGDQMRFTFSITLSNAIAKGPPGPNQLSPGLLFGGTCTVTAT